MLACRESRPARQKGRTRPPVRAHRKDVGLLRCPVQGATFSQCPDDLVLTTAVNQGKQFEFQMPFGSYIMENVLFKISYPAEFHAQTAVEAAHTIHAQLKALGKSSDDIKSVRIRTQEAAVRIIDKQGPLDNFADREWVNFFFVSSISDSI